MVDASGISTSLLSQGASVMSIGRVPHVRRNYATRGASMAFVAMADVNVPQAMRDWRVKFPFACYHAAIMVGVLRLTNVAVVMVGKVCNARNHFVQSHVMQD
jgi:hypothetical protein